ncbi:cytochrome P450 [Xylaria arbuscula]|nr:cytochrome P450 [Xylaria arbuscula]
MELLHSVVCGICVLFPVLLFIKVYHALFDPLNQYPGPFLARYTNAYGGYYAIKKCLHLPTYQNFQRYGPVIRQAPNRLVFNTVTALHDIYLSPTVTKGEAYRSSQLRAKYPSIINVIDRDQHRRKRKYIGPVLSALSMRSFEPVMGEQINVFLKALLDSARGGYTLNMTERCQRLGLDIIGLLSFGYEFNTKTQESFRFLPGIIDAMSWRISIYMQIPLFKFMETPLLWLGKKQVIRCGDTITSIIKARTAKPKDAHHDLYSMVADLIGKEQDGLYRGELWPEAILFIIAGGTTTATAMSAMFFYLAQNPTAYATLASEIRSTFASADEICSGPQLTGCKYLRACIDETLRMAPPSLTILWREAEADRKEPFIVDGHVIPRGTQVGISLYSLLHNPEYFPDPFTFSPERWLDEQDDEGPTSVMRKAFAPFLIGDRACAGRAMAYLEMSLTLARTYWHFDFEFAPGEAGNLGRGKAEGVYGRGRPDEYQLDDIFVAAHQGPNLVFREREEGGGIGVKGQ